MSLWIRSPQKIATQYQIRTGTEVKQRDLLQTAMIITFF